MSTPFDPLPVPGLPPTLRVLFVNDTPLRGEDLRRAVRDRHGETAGTFWVDGRWFVGWMSFSSTAGGLVPALLTAWNDGETEETALRAALSVPAARGLSPSPSGLTWSSRG